MDRFVNSILPQVPGCSKAAIEDMVLRTAIQFCQDSLIWQLAGTETILNGNSELTLDTASDSQIAHCYIFENEKRYNNFTRSGATVTLYDAVTADTEFDTISFLKPTEDASALPSILYTDWFEGIEKGAESRLQIQPKKDWTDIKLAGVNWTRYVYLLNQAKVAARRTGVYTEFMLSRDTDY